MSSSSITSTPLHPTNQEPKPGYQHFIAAAATIVPILALDKDFEELQVAGPLSIRFFFLSVLLVVLFIAAHKNDLEPDDL